MLTFLCRRLFGRTQCKPAETKLTEETTENSTELQASLQENNSHCSDNEEIRSDTTPKKTTVLIMVAPPTDFQQVG